MEEKRESQFVYRISTQSEWEELQHNGSIIGGDLDRATGCIHLSDLHQVKMVLGNFFAGREDLYLLQINAAKIGEGLVYESADGTNYFPHFYGPERSFVPLPSDSVVKSEKLVLVGEPYSRHNEESIDSHFEIVNVKSLVPGIHGGGGSSIFALYVPCLICSCY